MEADNFGVSKKERNCKENRRTNYFRSPCSPNSMNYCTWTSKNYSAMTPVAKTTSNIKELP